MRKVALTWDDVETLIDHLLPQLEGDFQVLLMITRGGIVPGGMLAEALQITQVLTAAVDFPATMELQAKNLMSWPNFMQFPADDLLRAKRVLIVDDVWGSGRTVTAVKNRAAVAGAIPFSCVLHFNPYRNLFKPAEPDYYGATTDAYIVYPWEMDRDRDFSVGGWGLQR
jgi:hypoxanthine phosphoribosyltransferase